MALRSNLKIPLGFLLIALLVGSAFLFAETPTAPHPDPAFHVDARQAISFLASDDLEGRKGSDFTPGIDRAAILTTSPPPSASWASSHCQALTVTSRTSIWSREPIPIHCGENFAYSRRLEFSEARQGLSPAPDISPGTRRRAGRFRRVRHR